MDLDAAIAKLGATESQAEVTGDVLSGTDLDLDGLKAAAKALRDKEYVGFIGLTDTDIDDMDIITLLAKMSATVSQKKVTGAILNGTNLTYEELLVAAKELRDKEYNSFKGLTDTQIEEMPIAELLQKIGGEISEEAVLGGEIISKEEYDKITDPKEKAKYKYLREDVTERFISIIYTYETWKVYAYGPHAGEEIPGTRTSTSETLSEQYVGGSIQTKVALDAIGGYNVIALNDFVNGQDIIGSVYVGGTYSGGYDVIKNNMADGGDAANYVATYINKIADGCTSSARHPEVNGGQTNDLSVFDITDKEASNTSEYWDAYYKMLLKAANKCTREELEDAYSVDNDTKFYKLATAPDDTIFVLITSESGVANLTENLTTTSNDVVMNYVYIVDDSVKMINVGGLSSMLIAPNADIYLVKNDDLGLTQGNSAGCVVGRNVYNNGSYATASSEEVTHETYVEPVYKYHRWSEHRKKWVDCESTHPDAVRYKATEGYNITTTETVWNYNVETNGHAVELHTAKKNFDIIGEETVKKTSLYATEARDAAYSYSLSDQIEKYDFSKDVQDQLYGFSKDSQDQLFGFSKNSQDQLYGFSKNSQDQLYGFSKDSQDQLYGFSKDSQDQLYGFSKDSQDQLYGFSKDSQDQLYGFSKDSQDQLYGFNKGSQDQLFGFSKDSQDQLYGFNKDSQDQLYGFNKGSQDQLYGFSKDSQDQLFGFSKDSQDQLYGFNKRSQDQLFGFNKGSQDQLFGFNKRSQDQLFGFNKGSQDQLFGFNKGSQDQLFGFSKDAQDQLFGFNKGNQDQLFGFNKGSQDQLFGFNKGSQDQLFGFNKGSQDQLFGFNKGSQDQLFGFNKGSQDQLFGFNKGSQDQLFGFSKDAQDQLFGFNKGSQDQLFGFSKDAQDQLFGFDKNTQDQLFGFSKDVQDQLFGFKLDAQEEVFAYGLEATKRLYSYSFAGIKVIERSFYGERIVTPPPTDDNPPGDNPPPTDDTPTDDTLIITPPPAGAVLGANRPVEAEGTVLGARRSGSVLGARRAPGAVLGKRRSPKTADAAMGGMVAGMMLSMMTAFGGATVLKKKREDEDEVEE